MPTHDYSAIPAELRSLKQWIVWRYEDKGGKKATKIPYSTRHTLASVTNPSDWDTFNNAYNCLQMGGSYDGIGFVFTKDDPYAFIDLDDTEGDHVAQERQLKVFKEFDSYSELSPSGKGLHIIIKGSLPQGRRRSHIEIYSSERYATFTGQIYHAKPIADKHELLMQLFNQMGGPPNTTVIDGNSPETETDEQIIEKAKSASNGDKFSKLFSGEWESLYPSQSEADLAIIDIIAFYTQNRNQIIRIFRLSGLGRRTKANRSDYLNWMINKSFDRLIPLIDVDGFRIALEAKLAAGSVNGKPAAFDAADGGSNPSPASNPDQMQLPLNGNGPVAQLVEPAAHNGSVASSNLAGTTIIPPPGLVGDIARFIYEAAPRPVPEIAIAAAIGLMAGICGKAYNVSSTGLNQYVLLLAPTGTGKEAMASGIDKIINAVSMSVPVASEFVGPSEIQSGQALIKNLAENPSYVSILGEFGLRLRAMSSEKANGAEIALRRMLLDLYNKSGFGQVIRPTIYSDKAKNIAAISAPAFSILGESTPERFYEILTEEMISEGLLPRFMFIEYNGNRPAFNEGANAAQPSLVLIDRVAQLMANAKTIIANRSRIDVASTDEAAKMLYDFDKFADAKINNTEREIVRQLWNRAHIKVMKIAALIAVGCNPINPLIEADQVLWAKNIVEHDIRSLQKKFESGTIGKNTGEVKQLDEIKRMIRNYHFQNWEKIKSYSNDKRLFSEKWIPYSYLNKRLTGTSVFQNDKNGPTNALKRAIQILLDSDFIREIPKKELEKYNTTQRCFIVTNVSLLDLD